MKAILRYSAALTALGALFLFFWWHWSKPVARFKTISFDALPGFHETELVHSLQAFQRSCGAFLKQNPEKDLSSRLVKIQAKDWFPACRKALEFDPKKTGIAKSFFQDFFVPVEFYNRKKTNGLFTGYYLPSIKGSLKKTNYYKIPIYAAPKDLVSVHLGRFDSRLKHRTLYGRVKHHQVIPYYSSAQIDQGALRHKAKVLLWIHSAIDRLFLGIQGSGIIDLTGNKQIYIGYDGQNGQPYTALASVLIHKGVMTKDTASMQAIKRYLNEHPKQRDPLIHQNKSFVFFKILSMQAAEGSQGVALTPGYSLAIDKKWIPMGVPMWLSTSQPDQKNPDENINLQRLMIAQDTGGAIKGKVRGDVFWGGGDIATVVAGHMKNPGHYWMLLPPEVAARSIKDH